MRIFLSLRSIFLTKWWETNRATDCWNFFPFLVSGTRRQDVFLCAFPSGTSLNILPFVQICDIPPYLKRGNALTLPKFDNWYEVSRPSITFHFSPFRFPALIFKVGIGFILDVRGVPIFFHRYSLKICLSWAFGIGGAGFFKNCFPSKSLELIYTTIQTSGNTADVKSGFFFSLG